MTVAAHEAFTAFPQLLSSTITQTRCKCMSSKTFGLSCIAWQKTGLFDTSVTLLPCLNTFQASQIIGRQLYRKIDAKLLKHLTRQGDILSSFLVIYVRRFY